VNTNQSIDTVQKETENLASLYELAPKLPKYISITCSLTIPLETSKEKSRTCWTRI